MMKCLECGLHWTPLGGAGGQMIPECPVCTLRSRLAEAERDRDEARDWVRRMHAESQVLTCVFCGEAYPPGTAASGEPALVAHVNVCSKHPLAAERAAHEATKRDLEAVRTRGANAVLVPTDKLAELRAAKEQAEAALGRARELLERWRGLCCAALPTESVADVDAATRAFLAATPNTTKPTTEDPT